MHCMTARAIFRNGTLDDTTEQWTEAAMRKLKPIFRHSKVRGLSLAKRAGVEEYVQVMSAVERLRRRRWWCSEDDDGDGSDGGGAPSAGAGESDGSEHSDESGESAKNDDSDNSDCASDAGSDFADGEGEGDDRGAVYHRLFGRPNAPGSDTTTQLRLELCRGAVPEAWRGGLDQLEICLRLYLSMGHAGRNEPDHGARLNGLPALASQIRLREGLRLHRRKGDICTSRRVQIVRGSLLRRSDRGVRRCFVAIASDSEHRRLRWPRGHAADMLVPSDSEDEDEEAMETTWYAEVLLLFRYRRTDLAYVRYFTAATSQSQLLHVEFAQRPMFEGMGRRSAAYGLVGGPWLDVIEVGHILHTVHLLPDIRHYAECKERGVEPSEFWVNKDTFLRVPAE